jgi:putative transposase of IS4/5 family DUF4096/integrase-like protein
MIRDMQLQRLALRTQEASIAAVAGLAKFYCRLPDQLQPAQLHSYLHPLLVERRLAWSSCNQVACELKFFQGLFANPGLVRVHSRMTIRRHELTDQQWERLQPLLPPQKPPTGRPAADHRRILNGILWLLLTGAPWRDLPERYGAWQTVASRFYRWR